MKKLFIVLTLSVLSLFSVSAQTELETILSQIHADSLRKTVEDLVNFNNRLCCAMPENNKKVSQYIIQRLNSYGIVNAAIDSFPVNIQNHFLVGNVDQYMYNVKSRINGGVKPDSIIIIGAHLDAIAYDTSRIIQNIVPGANDNATGIAVMIEVARIFHTNNLVPRYSIDFMAYDAEELGLYGSIYDANKRKLANEKIYVMLNNDMVGLQEESDNEWKVVFHVDAEKVENKAKNICRDYTRLHPYLPDSTDHSYQYSDSWAYRMVGFKTFYTHEYEEDPHYHTISDLQQRINYNYMAEITKLHFAIIYDFVIENVIPETGINEPFAAPAFSLFPNPTHNQLRIKSCELRENIDIQIYDVVGRLLQSEIVNLQSEIIIDVSHLQSGIYIINIVYDKGVKVMRFLKE